MTARIAEASSTILFMLRCLAAFGEQFVDQRRAGFYVLPRTAPCSLNAALLGGDSQLIVLDTQNDFISSLDAKRLTECRGNDDATILVYPQSGFLFHVILHSK